MINKDRALLDFSLCADHDNVCELISIMEERYSFLRVRSIGETILQKKIHLLSLGNESCDKSVLYVGGQRGCEWITTLVLLRFINELCEYYKNSKQPFGINLQTLFSQRCLMFVPQLNCDGADICINGVSEDCILYERLEKMSNGDYSAWNANARGVDLVRNYSGGFNEYKREESEKGIACGPSGYSGENPFSEPETGALANFIRYNGTVKLLISLHAGGEGICHVDSAREHKNTKNIGKKLSALSGYKSLEIGKNAMLGGICQWFYEEFDSPSFAVLCSKEAPPISERKYFEIYAAVREMLLYAPVMI